MTLLLAIFFAAAARAAVRDTGDDTYGVRKGEAVRSGLGLQGSFAHQATDDEVGHHQSVELLANQVRRLAPRHLPPSKNTRRFRGRRGLERFRFK